MRTPEPPDQTARRQAIESEGRNILLQAGAGSGKTKTLIDRLEWLLSERGADLSRIVAITFTEKAAGELKERLRDLCDARAEAAASLDELDRWRTHRRAIDTAHVGTIHGFCSRLLHAHAIRIGIDPLTDVLDDAQAQLLLQDTMRRFALEGLRSGSPPFGSLFTSLGLFRLTAALVSVVRRRAKLSLDRLAGSSEAVLAQWREAQAEEVRATVSRLRSDPDLQAAVELLRATQPRDPEDLLAPVREQALRAAAGAFDESLDPRDALVHWRALAAVPKAGNKGRKENWPEGTLAQVREATAALRAAGEGIAELSPSDEALEPNAAELTAHFHAILPDALAAYAAAKRERSAVDFDDQLLLARDLLRDHLDVRESEQQRFEYILVDEFQDTDPVQREIIWYLVEDRVAGGSPGPQRPLRPGKLFLVGDAKQSIYGFRGADVTVYNDTRASFEAKQSPSSTTLSLTANFRSQARLVSLFNEFFAQDAVMGPDRPERAPFEAHYEPLEATRGPAEDGVDVSFLLAVDPEANLEELRTRAADAVARYITEAVRGGKVRVAERTDDGEETWRPAEWKDVLVLLPTMSNVAIYERALREHQAPYYVVAGRGFFARPEIMDVIALLRVLDEPRDEIALARVLRAPWCGVSDEGLYQLAREGGLAKGLQSGACQHDPDAERARWAARMLAELRTARHHVPLADLVERVLDETALPTFVATRFDGPRAYANLRKLVETARSFEAGGPVLLSRFIEHVETLRLEEIRQGEAPAEEEQGDAVTVMTIHKAKGLQRPIVVVADLARGGGRRYREAVVLHADVGPVLRGEMVSGKLAFPPIGDVALADEAARETAERRRLLYVALTRARDRLVISTPIPLDRDGNPAKAGVWVESLVAGFGPGLLTEDSIAGESGKWSGEIIRGERPGPGGSRRPSSLLYRHLPEIAACRPLPGGDEAEEAAIAARMAAIPPDLAAKARFTVTELAHYLHCPHSYELAHVRGLARFVPSHEPLGPGKLKAHERGTVVHRALQRLGRGPISDIQGEVEAAMRECGLAGHDPAEVADILAMLVRFTGSRTWEMVRTARELRSEVPVVAPLAGGLIEGQIDALIRDWDGGLHLIDYKTGRSEDSGTREEHRFQVGAYAAAVQQAHGHLPATVAVHYLEADERVDVDPAEAVEAARRSASMAIRGVRAGEFTPRPECDGRDCGNAWVCGHMRQRT